MGDSRIDIDRCAIEKRLEHFEEKLDTVIALLNEQAITVAVHEKQMSDLPGPATLKWYATIGGSVVMVLGLLGYAVSVLVKSPPG